uniref:Putative secreted peptide n=1 Tax=Anopheles braziliensis TaxID=58242 RepID=A0A2M3ZW66_9DIPT
MILFIAASSFLTEVLLSFTDCSSWMAVCFCCCKILISLSRTLRSFCWSALRSSSFWNTFSKLSVKGS